MLVGAATHTILALQSLCSQLEMSLPLCGNQSATVFVDRGWGALWSGVPPADCSLSALLLRV